MTGRAGLDDPGGGLGERGSGTVMAVGVVGVLSVLLVAGVLIAAAVVAGQHARTGADLAALAAAGELMVGADAASACNSAGRVAESNGATLVRCTVTAAPASFDGLEISLPQVRVTVDRLVGVRGWVASAQAVAGGTLP